MMEMEMEMKILEGEDVCWILWNISDKDRVPTPVSG